MVFTLKVNTVERPLLYKLYTLAASLEIEGEFNNVSTNTIKETLTRMVGYLTHSIISTLRRLA